MKRSPARALSIAALAVLVGACTGSGSSASPGATDPGASPAVSPAASPAASPEASAPAADAVTVTGVEYAFEGAPATAAVGTEFAFRNGGQELHELILVRKNDGVTDSWEELLQLPDEEAFAKVTVVGQAMAEPGQEAEGTVAAEEAGDYLMICFVPAGMKELPSESLGPDASLPTGEPHFLKGMRHELTVE